MNIVVTMKLSTRAQGNKHDTPYIKYVYAY